MQIREMNAAKFSSDPFVSIGHTLELPQLPELSPSKCQDGSKVRLIKDVLSTGEWFDANDQPWNVTEADLQTIANDFAKAQAKGNAFNWIWGHSEDNRDAITPIDQVLVANGRLWATGYFDPKDAAELKNPSRKVSVRVADRGWKDGSGETYDQMLLHAAVVELPVVSGQGPFREASHGITKLLKTRDMAMDFEALKGLFAELLPDGVTVPDDATEEDFITRMTDIVNVLKQAAGEDVVDTPDDGESDDLADGDAVMPEGEFAVAMSKVVKPLEESIKQLSQRLDSLQTDKTDNAKSKFEATLTELGEAGVPAVEIKKLRTLGQKLDWDQSILEMAQKLATVDMSNVSKGQRNGKPPKTNGRLTDEEVDEILGQRGIDKSKKPVFRQQ